MGTLGLEEKQPGSKWFPVGLGSRLVLLSFRFLPFNLCTVVAPGAPPGQEAFVLALYRRRNPAACARCLKDKGASGGKFL